MTSVRITATAFTVFLMAMTGLAGLAQSQTQQAQSAPTHHVLSLTDLSPAQRKKLPGYITLLQRDDDPTVIEAGRQADAVKTAGEARLKSGDADGAIADFTEALSIEPHDGLVLQRLAEAQTMKGQTAQAIITYRTLLYHVPGQRWGNSNETSPTVLMRFTLLLQQAGKTQEASAALYRALGFLNAAELGTSSVPIPGPGTDGIPDTTQGFQAVAHLALFVDTFGHEGYGDPEPLTHLQKALALAPDSAVANYYMGKYLLVRDRVQAKAYLQKAVDLGDDQTAAAAKIYLSILR